MYLILEIQHFDSGATAIPPLVTKDDMNEAYAAFYSVCAVAAVSSVLQHTVVLMDYFGNIYDKKSFNHGGSEDGE